MLTKYLRVSITMDLHKPSYVTLQQHSHSHASHTPGSKLIRLPIIPQSTSNQPSISSSPCHLLSNHNFPHPQTQHARRLLLHRRGLKTQRCFHRRRHYQKEKEEEGSSPDHFNISTSTQHHRCYHSPKSLKRRRCCETRFRRNRNERRTIEISRPPRRIWENRI